MLYVSFSKILFWFERSSDFIEDMWDGNLKYVFIFKTTIVEGAER